jgi:hypothetical protein
MNNIETIKQNVSTGYITFLVDIDKSIDIDKTSRAKYYRSFGIELDNIKNFIDNLDYNEVYLVNPLVSINCTYNEPYLNLSRQFLVSSKSSPFLIYNYLLNQIETSENCFNFDLDNFFLLFKYKIVYLEYKIIGK